MEDWNLAMRLGSLNRESNVMLAGALSGQEFDLESGSGVIDALSAVILALSGSVKPSMEEVEEE